MGVVYESQYYIRWITLRSELPSIILAMMVDVEVTVDKIFTWWPRVFLIGTKSKCINDSFEVVSLMVYHMISQDGWWPTRVRGGEIKHYSIIFSINDTYDDP